MSASDLYEDHLALVDASTTGLLAIGVVALVLALSAAIAGLGVLWGLIAELMSALWATVRVVLLLTLCVVCFVALMATSAKADGAVVDVGTAIGVLHDGLG